MCCFSQPVESVTNTNIFARSSEKGRQFVVYSMTLDAKSELAMILPLPVAKDSPEDAVRFINLKEYPNFFEDLEKGFPKPPSKGRGFGGAFGGIAPTAEKLVVVEVGDFEASFVPTIADFSRLDERFRLPTEVWSKLPSYKEFGFAVFKLKKGAKTVHPMAFEFPRADEKMLFFPTVHIHDGEVHAKAEFDHTLYCQENPGEQLRLLRWVESPQPASMFMDVKKSSGLIAADQHCHKLRIVGMQRNGDVVV